MDILEYYNNTLKSLNELTTKPNFKGNIKVSTNAKIEELKQFKEIFEMFDNGTMSLTILKSTITLNLNHYKKIYNDEYVKNHYKIRLDSQIELLEDILFFLNKES